MSTVAQKAKPEINVRTRLSFYDRVSSMLTAWVMLIGLLVLVMLLIWLYMVTDVPKKQPLVYEAPGFENEENPEGVAEDMEEPGVEEFPEVEEPQLADALEAVTDVASTVRANLEEVDGNAPEMGTGKGLGDRRTKGAGRGTGNLNLKRWRINYVVSNQKEYARMLDSLKIEIGVFSLDSGRIEYISNLSGSKPSSRTGTRDGRMYTVPQKAIFRAWDAKLVADAGVEVGSPDVDRIFQFYPAEVKQKLIQLEQRAVNSNSLSIERVTRTRFKVEKSGGGYEFKLEGIDTVDGKTY
jgi:hypothetical protein